MAHEKLPHTNCVFTAPEVHTIHVCCCIDHEVLVMVSQKKGTTTSTNYYLQVEQENLKKLELE